MKALVLLDLQFRLRKSGLDVNFVILLVQYGDGNVSS